MAEYSKREAQIVSTYETAEHSAESNGQSFS
jgi:hypothetical protein